MPLQTDLDKVYMYTARLHSTLSKAERKKVGACIVTSTGIIIPGYNGTPQGADNACEHILKQPIGRVELVTKQEVIHAELNCILKAAKEGVSIQNSVLYVTLSPCLPCSSMIIQSGIKEVVFSEDYRDISGVEYLQRNGVQVRKL